MSIERLINVLLCESCIGLLEEILYIEANCSNYVFNVIHHLSEF